MDEWIDGQNGQTEGINGKASGFPGRYRICNYKNKCYQLHFGHCFIYPSKSLMNN